MKKGYFTFKKMYIFDHVPLIYSQNEKCFRQNCRGNQNVYLAQNQCFSKKSDR